MATRDILDEARRSLVRDERAALEGLRVTFERFGAEATDRRTLDEAALTLDELFLLVVVGEFNAGKSAVINALVGATVSREGILPTTAAVTVLRHGDVPSETSLGEAYAEVRHPAEFLREIAIVDTPGTNAIVREHEAITARYAPRADLALFITSVDRPLSESERAFVQRLREWGKPVVVVLNKIDLLDDPAQIAELTAFVRDNARTLLGFTPEVIPVSARLAQRAASATTGTERDELDARSGFAALRRFVFETLDPKRRLRLKLENPLGIAERTLARLATTIDARESVLGEDRATEAAIADQLAGFREDALADFGVRTRALDAIFLETTDRADRFFESTIRLARIPDLLNTSRIKDEFTKAVLADNAVRIDDEVRATVDRAIDAQGKLWSDISEYLVRRRGSLQDDALLGRLSGTAFAQDRRTVLDATVRSTRRVVAERDNAAEAERFAASVRDAAAQTGLVGAGAVGLGVVVVTAIGGAAADVTGILAGVVIAALGLYIIPSRRRAAQARFARESEALRAKLVAALRERYLEQLDTALADITAAVAPFARFVRAEDERIADARAEIDGHRGAFARLRAAIAREAPE